MKADEEGITHMAKAKFSKGFELFGEHLLPLQKVKEVQAQGESWAGQVAGAG
jgi:hypothetical protein